jgi:hypothetical protein
MSWIAAIDGWRKARAESLLETGVLKIVGKSLESPA